MAARRRAIIRLSAPKVVTFVVSLIIAVLAFLIAAGVINNPLKSFEVVWIALVAWLILTLGVLIDGL